jgi:colicin import membrane protein
MSSSYRLPLIISVVMHLLLLVAVTWGWSASSTSEKVYKPRYVEAKLVELKPKTVKKAAPQKTPRKIDVAAKRRQQEEQKRAAEKKRQQELKAKRAAEDKARKEKARKEKLEQERLAEQQRQKELERQEQERQAQERQQQEFDDALAEEEALLAEEQDAAVAQSYVALIVDRIERNWSRPASARRGMVCELRLQLVPTGEVVNVSIVKSSGNSAFDRSAEQAVKKAGRFSELQQVEPAVFEAYFRQLTIKFNPKDLRL